MHGISEKGVRHYPIEPNKPGEPYDPLRPRERRVWPWKEMNVFDYVLVEDATLFDAAANSARQYGHRHDEKYRTHQVSGGMLIWRSK